MSQPADAPTARIHRDAEGYRVEAGSDLTFYCGDYSDALDLANALLHQGHVRAVVNHVPGEES